MIRNGLVAASLALLSLSSFTGCGGQVVSVDDEDEVDDAAIEQALSACSSSKYQQGLRAYKRAVAWSKDRLSKGVCESEYGYQWGIADETSRAVQACASFRDVVRNSPYAWPIREVLSTSLTLRSLSGELLVIRDSPYQNWSGVERHFGAGLSFWARGQGAYGSPVRIDFAEEGKATYGHLVYDEPTGDISWQKGEASYTIEQAGTRAQDPRRITVTHSGGVVETYRLGVENPGNYSDAPVFTLQPISPAATESGPFILYSLVSECDA